jgi:hypothetical protein
MTTSLLSSENFEAKSIAHPAIDDLRIGFLATAPQPERMLHVSLRNATETEQSLRDWAALEQRLSSERITASCDWLKQWLKIYSKTINYQFAVATHTGALADEDQIQAMTLVVHSHLLNDGPIKMRTIHIGTAGEKQGDGAFVEYNTVLAEPSIHTEFISKLVKLLQHQSNWDEIRLDGIHLEDWESLQQLEKLTLNPKHTEFVAEAKSSRFMDLRTLRQSGSDVMSVLGKSTKSNLKRKLKTYQNLKLEWAETIPHALEIFDDLVAHHQARWESIGMPGAFASTYFKDFQQSILKQFIEQKKIIVFRAQQDGKTIGCLMLLVDQNRMLDYLSGFAPLEKGTSPGLVTHYLCMEEALKRGFDAYDFLVGEKQHKENLGKSATDIYWCSYRKKNVMYHIKQVLRYGKHKLEQWRKKKPVAAIQAAIPTDKTKEA